MSPLAKLLADMRVLQSEHLAEQPYHHRLAAGTS
jgi:hypothetical protein